MPARFFGVEITDVRAVVAAVEKRLRGYTARGERIVSIEGMSPSAAAEALAGAMAELDYDPGDHHAAAVFPGGKLSSRMLTVPLAGRRKIMETLPYEIESGSTFDADELAVDYITLESSEKGTKLLAAIALKRDLAEFLGPLHAAGVEPEMIIPAPQAVTAALADAIDDGKARLFFHIGPRGTDITLANGGLITAFHNAAAGVDSGMTDGGLAAFLALESERLKESARGSGLDADAAVALVSGAGAASRSLRESLGEKLGARVETAVPPQVPEANPEAAAALAAALILAGAAKGEALSLAADGAGRKRRLSKTRAQAAVAAGLLGLVGLFAAASFAAEEMRLNRKYENLKNTTRAVFHEAMPEVKKIVSEKQQLANALVELEEKSEFFGAALEEKDPFLDRLLGVSRAAPEDVRVDIDEMIYEQGKIILSGRTESFEKVERLKENISRLPWAVKVSVEKAEVSAAGGAITFRIEVEAAS